MKQGLLVQSTSALWSAAFFPLGFGAQVLWSKSLIPTKFVQEQLGDKWVEVTLVVMALMAGLLGEEGSEFPSSALGKGLVSTIALQEEWGQVRRAGDGQRDPDAEVASEDFECLLFQSAYDVKSPLFAALMWS